MTQFESLRAFATDLDEEFNEKYLGEKTLKKMRDAKLFADESEQSPAEVAAPVKSEPETNTLSIENTLLEQASQQEEDAFVMEEQFAAAVFKREMDPTIENPTVRDWARVARRLQQEFVETFSGRTRNILNQETHRYSQKTRRPDGVMRRRPHSSQNHTALQNGYEWDEQMASYFNEKQSDIHRKNRSKKGLTKDRDRTPDMFPQYMTPHEMKEIEKAKKARKERIDQTMNNALKPKRFTPGYTYKQKPIDNSRYERNAFSE